MGGEVEIEWKNIRNMRRTGKRGCKNPREEMKNHQFIDLLVSTVEDKSFGKDVRDSYLRALNQQQINQINQIYVYIYIHTHINKCEEKKERKKRRKVAQSLKKNFLGENQKKENA